MKKSELKKLIRECLITEARETYKISCFGTQDGGELQAVFPSGSDRAAFERVALRGVSGQDMGHHNKAAGIFMKFDTSNFKKLVKGVEQWHSEIPNYQVSISHHLGK